MIRVKLDRLIGRLNETSRTALEGAVGLCHSQKHYQVEVEHVFAKLLDEPDNDMVRIARALDVHNATLLKDLARTLTGFKRGNTGGIELSQRVESLIVD